MAGLLHDYTEIEIAAIAAWLRMGLPASRIAENFSRQFAPITRNAVIGIVHRNPLLKAIGLGPRASARTAAGHGHEPKRVRNAAASAGRASASRKAGGVKARGDAGAGPHSPPPVARTPRQVDVAGGSMRRRFAADAAPRAVPMAMLRGCECRFAVNESGPAGHLFCGLPTDGGSWCEDHKARVFAPRVPSHLRLGSAWAGGR